MNYSYSTHSLEQTWLFQFLSWSALDILDFLWPLFKPVTHQPAPASWGLSVNLVVNIMKTWQWIYLLADDFKMLINLISSFCFCLKWKKKCVPILADPVSDNSWMPGFRDHGTVNIHWRSETWHLPNLNLIASSSMPLANLLNISEFQLFDQTTRY